MGALRQKNPLDRRLGEAPGTADPRAALVARVLAWQHRHPLASRLHPQQVDSVGWVAVPFAVPGPAGAPVDTAPDASVPSAQAGGPRLRERALARAREGAPAPAPATMPAATTAATTAAAPAAAPAATPAATPSRRGWRPAFDERLPDGPAPSRLARWALRHGSVSRPAAAVLPVREVAPGAAHGDTSASIVVLWLATAELRDRGRARRIFLAPDGAAVLGRRLWAPARLGIAALAAGALAATLASVPVLLESKVDAAIELALRGGASASAPVAPKQLPNVAPIVAPIVAPNVAASLPPTWTAAAPVPAPATSAAASPMAPPTAPSLPPPETRNDPQSLVAMPSEAPAPPAAPATAKPDATAGEPPRIVTRRPIAEALNLPGSSTARIAPSLDEATRAEARAAGDAARRALAEQRAVQMDPAARGSGAMASNASSASSAGMPDAAAAASEARASAVARAAPPPLPANPVWALSTRTLRTRFESEQALVALRDVAARHSPATPASAPLRFEVLPTGSDFRAVSWPYPDRRAAERVRAELLARGVAVEVVGF